MDQTETSRQLRLMDDENETVFTTSNFMQLIVKEKFFYFNFFFNSIWWEVSCCRVMSIIVNACELLAIFQLDNLDTFIDFPCTLIDITFFLSNPNANPNHVKKP